MPYGIDDLRTQVRQYARNALDSSVYPNMQIDLSLQLAGDEWVRETRGARTLATLALTPNSNVLPALPADCSAERILQVFLLLSGQIVNPEFAFTSYEEIQRAQYEHRSFYDSADTNPAGRPQKMAFLDGGATGIVWPTPTAAYSIELWYSQPFTTWTAGTTPSPNSFNLPDEHLRVIARFGAPGYLQLNEKTNGAIAQANLEEFRRQAKRFTARGSGSRGGQVSSRVSTWNGR